MKRNPVRARAQLDWAPCSHPREAPCRGFREQTDSREEIFLLDARIQRELEPLDYALCRTRDMGGSWAAIAALLSDRLGGAWSPQRAAARTRRAQRRLDQVLAKIRDLETENTPGTGPATRQRKERP